MSGHTEALLLIFGAASVVLVIWLVWRMGIVDREGVPIQHGPRVVPYFLWLFKEMVASSFAIAKTVTAKEVETQPQLLRVEGIPGDSVAQTLYANSITLTPGTATLDVDDEHLLVHALTDEAAEGLRSGEMRRRVLQTMDPSQRPSAGSDSTPTTGGS